MGESTETGPDPVPCGIASGVVAVVRGRRALRLVACALLAFAMLAALLAAALALVAVLAGALAIAFALASVVALSMERKTAV